MNPVQIPPPDVLRDRIRAGIASTRPAGFPPRMRAILAIVAVLIAIAIGVLRMRPDIALLPVPSLIGVTFAVALLAVATLVVALSPGAHGLGAPLTMIATLAATTAPLYAVITIAAGLGVSTDGPAVRGCFSASIGVAVLCLGGLTFALRRSVPAAPIARGALLGACAGAWSGLTQHLHCPCGEALHILIGHAIPIVICTTLGAVISPRFLRP
jgi:hypothetical protein